MTNFSRDGMEPEPGSVLPMGWELDRAHAVVAVHIPTTAGFCYGCLDQWSRLAPWECEPLKWAKDAIRASSDAEAVAGIVEPCSAVAIGDGR